MPLTLQPCRRNALKVELEKIIVFVYIYFTEILEKPIIIKGPSDQISIEKGECRFEAEVHGIPKPTVQW